MNKTFRVSKALLLATSLVFVLSASIYGTMAWLADESDPMINTFTYGDINITLMETDTNTDGDNDPNTNEYSMMPGQTITKDPLVTVLANSEDAWLFVELKKSANFDDFMVYEMAEGWAALPNIDGVYYRTVDKATVDEPFPVIKDNAVTVKGEVTKEMLNTLDANGVSNYPTLTITAYAVQRDSNIATAADAWAKVAPTP